MVVADSDPGPASVQQLSALEPDLAQAATTMASGHYQDGSVKSVFVRRPVADTGWSLLITVPAAGLLAPLNSGRLVPWIIFAALALLGMLVCWTTLRLLESRERRAAEQEVALQREHEVVVALQQLNEARTDFVGAVSHDLRTPLTSVMGYLELLQEGAAGPLEERQAEMVDAVARNSRRLANLVEDLLDAARLSPDSGYSSTELVDMAALLRRVWDATKDLAAGRKLLFELDIPCEGAVVVGQSARLERVLVNLLNNAVKFTDDGGLISLAARLEADTITVEVRDTGMGISAADQAQLFQPFFRAARSRDHIAGTGLGLAVVAGIVAQHSGTVEVVSVEDHGTTMRVRLPLAAVSTATPPGATPVVTVVTAATNS
jgi:signal transduction histidine kinase